MGDDNDSPQTMSVNIIFDLKDKPKELLNVLITLKVSL